MIGASRAGFYKKRINPTVTPTKKKKNPIPSHSSSSSSNRLSVPTNPPIRKRSGSAPAIKQITLATTWNLKHDHVRAIRATWSRLCEPPRSNCRGIVSLVERVWEKLDNKDKDMKNIFFNAAFVDSMHERCDRRRSGSIATLRDHTHFFVSLVSQVVMSLDIDPTKILEHLDRLGQNHAYLKRYGFKSSHWEKVGEYFVDIVVIQDCVRAYPDACRAWTILISSIVDRLRAAPRRGSYISVLSESHRGSTPNMNTAGGSEEKLCCPVTNSKSTNKLCLSEGNERRGSIVLPATTIDMSHLEDALPKKSPLIAPSNVAA